jgi:hypothetical protein
LESDQLPQSILQQLVAGKRFVAVIAEEEQTTPIKSMECIIEEEEKELKDVEMFGLSTSPKNHCVCGFGVIDRPSADVITADCPYAPSKRSSTMTLKATLLPNLDDLNIGNDIIHTIGLARKNWQVGEMQAAGENQQTPRAQFIHHMSDHQASVLTWDLTLEVDFGTDAVQYITNNIGNIDSTIGSALKTPLGCTYYHNKSVMRSFDVKQSHLVAVQNSTDGPAYFGTCYADGRKVAKDDHELQFCIHATTSEHTEVATVIEKIVTTSYEDVRSSYFLGDSPWTQTTSDKHGVQPLFF